MIDIHNKQYQTRSGYPVTLYTDTYNGSFKGFPIVGVIHKDGRDFIEIWTREGRASRNGKDSDNNLVEAPPKHEIRVFLVKSAITGSYRVRAEMKSTTSANMAIMLHPNEELVGQKIITIEEGRHD